jgi:hypothetical protein
LLNAFSAIFLSINLESFIKKTLPASAIFEISMLRPIQPARFAVADSGFLFIIISVVKNCFGIIRKFSTSQLFEYVKKKN